MVRFGRGRDKVDVSSRATSTDTLISYIDGAERELSHILSDAAEYNLDRETILRRMALVRSSLRAIQRMYR